MLLPDGEENPARDKDPQQHGEEDLPRAVGPLTLHLARSATDGKRLREHVPAVPRMVVQRFFGFLRVPVNIACAPIKSRASAITC